MTETTMASGFTRKEAIILCGMKANRVDYLHRMGIVTARALHVNGSCKKMYSPEQVFILKFIARMRGLGFSLQEIRKVISLLAELDYKPSIMYGRLMIVSGKLFLIDDDAQLGQIVIQISGESRGQIMIRDIGALRDVLDDLKQEAIRHQILDFSKRIHSTLLDYESHG